MTSFAATPAGAGRRGAGCRGIPFIPLACLLILAVGIPLWVLYSYTAVSSTSQALSAADIDTGAIQSALGTLNVIRVVVLALAIVAMVVVLLLSIGHMLSKRQSRRRGVRAAVSRPLLAADSAATLLLWLVLTGAVVLLALTATWFLGSMAIDGLLTMATRYSSDAEKAANRAVASSQTLVDQLRTIQLAALDVAPREVKDSQWYKDFRTGVNNFNQTVAVAARTPSSANCQPGCISLDFLAGLAGLDSTCICLTNTITNVQHGLQATQQATMYSLIGLGLVYLGTTWLLMWFASTYTSTRRDLKEHRRLAKSSSTGEGVYSSGSSSGSADAAIEIHADSPIAAYKQGSAAVLVPRAGHAGYPCMQNVTADARGERDVGPRLPYV